MALQIPRNLLLFGVFTSLGYVAFAAFLPGASSGFLLLNTYAWIFGFRAFANGLRRPRWPLDTLRILIDTNDLLFAACAFGYWCLFWFGIKLVPSGSDASQSAVAFLALNAVLLPVASHFAAEKSQRGKFFLFYLAFGVILILSVVAMELDTPATELGAGLTKWLSGLKLAVVAPRIFWSRIASNISAAASISIPAVCFVLAISLEALGDFFVTRREEILKTSAGVDLWRLQLAAAEIIYVRKFIRKQPLSDLVNLTRRVEDEEVSRMRESISARFDALSQAATLKVERELADEFMSAYEEALDNAKFLKKIKIQIDVGGERVVTRRDRKRLFKIAEERCWPDMIKRSSAESESHLNALALDTAKHAGNDLMAVLGLALAIVIFLATGASLPKVQGTEIVGAVVGAVMLGALGSSARILFITPMIRSEGATAALVPPIYAIRPIILLLIILGVQAAGVADWLATSGIAPAAANLSVEHNEGWFAGAIMAGAAAIAIWIVSVQDIKRRRARTSRINQGPGS